MVILYIRKNSKKNSSNVHWVHTSLTLSDLPVLCVCKNLIPYPDYFSVVIVLSMGSAKKKPMTKKEREEKRRKHKEKHLKK
jgi:hypothetical protein